MNKVEVRNENAKNVFPKKLLIKTYPDNDTDKILKLIEVWYIIKHYDSFRYLRPTLYFGSFIFKYHFEGFLLEQLWAIFLNPI